MTGPKEVVQLDGPCALTREGQLWLLTYVSTDNGTMELTPRTVPNARGVVAIEATGYEMDLNGCFGTRADGRTFSLTPSELALAPSQKIGAVHVEDAGPFQPDLGAPYVGRPFEVGARRDITCGLHPRRGTQCRMNHSLDRFDPSFDILTRSTKATQVIPWNTVADESSGP